MRGFSALPATHEPADGGHQLFGLLLLVAIGRADDAMLRVLVEQPERHLVERGLHGADLREDVDAVAVVLDHPLEPPDLALDALEAPEQLVLGRAVAARGNGAGAGGGSGGHTPAVYPPRGLSPADGGHRATVPKRGRAESAENA